MNATISFLVRRALPVLALVSLLAGCPQVPNPDPLPASPTIGEFKASATQVTAGSTVTLSWKVENATEVRIEDLALGAVSGVSGNESTVDVSVSGDTTFVLSATNARGARASAVVSIRVSGTAREPLFVAVPESIEAGASSTLAWSAPGASSATLTAAPGGAVDVGGQSATGTVTVTPTVTTEYTLTANGLERKLTVAVAPKIATFAATSTSNDGGTTIRVAWTTVGATRVQLNGVGRGQLADVTDAARVSDGTFEEPLPTSVDPGQYFTYELVATGASGSTSRTVVFGIPGNPAIVTFTGPAVARHGDGGVATFNWSTLETTQLSLSAAGVEIYRAPAASIATGTITLPVPEADTEYTLTARGTRGGETTKTLLLDVVSQPTVTLQASPAMVAAGEPVTLSWTGTHIRNVSISEVGYGSVFSASGSQDTGSATVSPARDSTFIIDVDNGLGDHATAMAQVTVTGSIVLTAETGAIRQGQLATLTWTGAGGAAADVVGLPHNTVTVRAASTGFDDIATTGTTLTFPTTTALPAPLVSGFRMPFFGRVVGQTINVSHHGYLGFAELNGNNSTARAMPTPYLEDFVIAPYWFSMSASVVRWQIKPESGGQVLIVQWNSTTVVTQAKLHSSGQIDFEYKTLPTTGTYAVGITGRLAGQTTLPPGTPAAGQGFTFFGPLSSPATIPVWEEGDVMGHLVLSSGALLRVSGTFGQVVQSGELAVNEVLANSTAGVTGQWAELRNARTTPLTLDGWSFALPDGGSIPLTGTVPARGVLVVGASTDGALNGDAGVQVAIPNFDLTGITNLALQRGGTAQTLTLTTTAGVAQQNSVGSFRYSDGGTGNQTCAATASFGSQLGTPGTDTNCGFAYDLAAMPVGFFDISDAGTTLTGSTFDDVAFTVDLSSAPVNFFGTPRTSGVVTTNGLFAFETSVSTTEYLATNPSTSAPNSLVAILAGDLSSTAALGGRVSVFRAGMGVDPFAAAPHWILQWSHYYRLSCSDADLNFQIKLFDDGPVELHYGRMLSKTSSQCAISALSTTSTWLENTTGTQALSVSSREVTPAIRPNTAFRYTPR